MFYTYLTNLLGPDYKITDGSFQTEEFNYTYDEEKQGYLVPVTSMVAMYTPEVEKISTQSGKTYVTVGYIPTINNSLSGEITRAVPTEPTKYMDYSDYERDSETGSIILPKLEVDTYLTNLLGPDYKITDGVVLAGGRINT